MLALKDRLKYYRNYDSSKRKRGNEDEAQEPQKKRVFTNHHKPNCGSTVDLTDIGEDRPSFECHVRYLQAEEKKMLPNKEVTTKQTCM